MFFGEGAINRTSNWQSSPNNRGPMTILTSCVTTLLLCVWTALHLNIPGYSHFTPGASAAIWGLRAKDGASDPTLGALPVTDQQINKVHWLVLGLLAPEMVVFTAWEQRRQAQLLSKKLKKIWDCRSQNELNPSPLGRDRTGTVGDSPTRFPTPIPRVHDWTITHSFFAIMGGFCFDTIDLPEAEKFLPGARDRVILKPRAVLALAKYTPSLLPDISKAEIQDKSKASGLTKAIVCLQATWFIIQVIVRLARHLSISLLELNTFSHAWGALLLYYLWWDKPLDIEEPTAIRGEQMRPVYAAFCHGSTFDDIKDSERLSVPLACSNMMSNAILPTYAQHNINAEPPSSQNLENVEVIHEGQQIGPFSACRSMRLELGRKAIFLFFDDVFYPNDRRRWVLASSWPGLEFTENYEIRELLCDSMRNWPSRFYTSDGAIGFALCLAGFVYGGFHLTGWNAPFETPLELMAWHVSVIIIASFGPAITSILYWSPRRVSVKSQRRPVSWFEFPLYCFLLIQLCCAVCLMARVFIIAECFISFAYLPESVFEEPSWTFYFPHIS